jgi:hypothetical protein
VNIPILSFGGSPKKGDDVGTDFHAADSAARLCFNGINGASGDYLFPVLHPSEIAAIASHASPDLQDLNELQKRWRRSREQHFAPIAGVDSQNLSEAGWGIIFGPNVTAAEKEALSPLLKMR